MVIWISAFAGAVLARFIAPRVGLAALLAPILPGWLVSGSLSSMDVVMAAMRLNAAAGTQWATPIMLGLIAATASFLIGVMLAALRAP